MTDEQGIAEGRAPDEVDGANEHHVGTEQAADSEPSTGDERSSAAELAALGARLKKVRVYLDLSQQYVSDKTGIPRSAISDIERGERRVDSLELKKFSKLFGYPVSHFLGVEEEVQDEVHSWARAMTELTEGDREQVMKFAQYLRYSAQVDRRSGRR